MPTTEDYLSRVEELEGLLYQFLSFFLAPSVTENSTFEGGKTLLDIEVSDDLEDLLNTSEQSLESSSLDEPFFEDD